MTASRRSLQRLPHKTIVAICSASVLFNIDTEHRHIIVRVLAQA